MFLKYVGTSDYRELSAADFTKLGAEANKTRFVQHEVVEVPDDTGDILLSHEFVKGEFEQVDDPRSEKELAELEAEAAEQQSESLKQAEAGGAPLPATTQRTGGATDAPSTGSVTGGTSTRRASRGSSSRV